MHSVAKSVLFGAMVAVAAGSISIAAEPTKRSASAPQRHDAAATAARAAAPYATGGASSSSARLVAVIDQGGGVVRSKGVQWVSNPGTGRYCIRPNAGSGINVNMIVPVVSVDYSNSSVHESLVQYRSSGDGCPTNTIAVVTFADIDVDGFWGFSNTVGFTIVVD